MNTETIAIEEENQEMAILDEATTQDVCPNRRGLKASIDGRIYTHNAVRHVTGACLDICSKEERDECVEQITLDNQKI